MNILDLFDSYFLLLIIIQGIIVAFFDAYQFRKRNAERAGRKAKTIGITMIVISLALYIARQFK